MTTTKTKNAATTEKAAELTDEMRWRTESDLRSLTEAARIKKDKPRYARALKLAEDQMAALKSIKTA